MIRAALRGYLLCLVAVTSGCGMPRSAPETGANGGLRFVDVAGPAGLDVVNVSGDPRRWYIPESNGTGAAWLDYDGDGDIDLFVGNGAGLRYIDDGRRLEIVRSASSRLYRNDGALRFTDVTSSTGAGRTEWINSVTTGDIDNDGDPDLYLGVFGRDVLLRNDGGVFIDATDAAGLGNELWAAGAAFADTDRDGDLDLYVANYVEFDTEHPPLDGRRNVIDNVEIAWGPEEENKRGLNRGAPDRFYIGDGHGRFVETTEAAGLGLDKPLCSYAVVFSDVDLDGWPDILVANDMQPANLFHNAGDGTFVEQAAERGFAYGAEGQTTSAMGLFVADVDGDGDDDVFRTNFDLEDNSLHLNDGSGQFVADTAAAGLAPASRDRLGWGGGFFDAELDGDLDLLVANGHVLPQAERIGMNPWLQQTQLFEFVGSESGAPRWRDATVGAGPGLALARSARGVALGDPDDDGDVDAVIIDLDSPPRLLENRSERLGHWLTVRTIGSRSNRDGLGAVVTVHAAGRRWTAQMRTTNGLYSAHDPRLHFGLGEVERVDRVVVRWPSGVEQEVADPGFDRLVTIEEPP
jgi:hypothetical protein